MWKVEQIIYYEEERLPVGGCAQLGFHDRAGRLYNLDYDHNWFGLVGDNNSLVWTAGSFEPTNSEAPHIQCDIVGPHYVGGMADGNIIVVSSGNKQIYRMNPLAKEINLLIDGEKLGLTSVGNCEEGSDGTLWLNEVTGNKVLHFTRDGELIEELGDGEAGFQQEEVSFEAVKFNWIFDLRRGPDGNIYVLDSKNYAVRKINVATRTVCTIVGTGKGGYSGDGGPATKATLGTNTGARFDGEWKKAQQFDGPWSLALDEQGNIFIGDTQNHVVRRVDAKSNVIATIAGAPLAEKDSGFNYSDPMSVKLPLICSLDYHDGRLFVPDWHDYLVVLKRC